ncbi:hypothetical protein BH10ACI4_BH10ACI4_35260 [soil metagenome]
MLNGFVPVGKREQLELRSEILGSTNGLQVGFSSVSLPVEIGTNAGLELAKPVLHVMVVDDDAELRQTCAEVAAAMGCAVVQAESVPAAEAILRVRKLDLLLLDLRLPGGGGLALLEQVKALYPETAVVVMTAFATVSSAVEAMRIGAGDYLTKPFAVDDLRTVIDRAGQRVQFHEESRRLRERLRTNRGMGGLVGQSPEMEKLYRILSKVAFSTHPVLILGESGTGKERVARAIHTNGPNAAKPFITVDCGALLPGSIESELFGHLKGAAGDQPSEGGIAGLGEGWDGLPERDRCASAGAAREAAAGFAGEGGPAGGFGCGGADLGAGAGGVGSGSRRDGGAGTVSEGPLLPAECGESKNSSTAGAATGYSCVGAADCRAAQCGVWLCPRVL